MSTVALITWLSAISIVTGFTGYFFYKVLTTPHVPDLPEDDNIPQGPKTFDAT